MNNPKTAGSKNNTNVQNVIQAHTSFPREQGVASLGIYSPFSMDTFFSQWAHPVDTKCTLVTKCLTPPHMHLSLTLHSELDPIKKI